MGTVEALRWQVRQKTDDRGQMARLRLKASARQAEVRFQKSEGI
jgi:hypothetical protein